MPSAATEQTSTRSTSGADAARPSGAVATTAGRSNGGEALASSQGSTTVAHTVVQKIAGRAAREVSGVHDFGGGASRAFGAITERIPGGRASSSRGVAVEVGEKQTAIDLDIVVEYGIPIGQLDLYLPEEDGGGESSEPARVT